jgi:hypothetical protein
VKRKIPLLCLLSLNVFAGHYAEPIDISAAMQNDGEDLKLFLEDEDRLVQLLRAGVAFGIEEFILMKNVGFMSTVEYQKSIVAKEDRWNRLGIGTEIIFSNTLSARSGYSFDLRQTSEAQKIEGFTYGIGAVTTEPIHLIHPFYLSFEYSRGLADYREFDRNIISVSFQFVREK